MKKIFIAFAAVLGVSVAFGAEGDVGTQAYQWANYKALDSVTYPNPAGLSLSRFQGKVILMNVFQYNCGGCDANAPRIGKMADSIGSGSVTLPFQALGTEIDNGTFAQIQTSYNSRLKSLAPNLNYPLVHVPFDTAITNGTNPTGTVWHRYNSYRDVYFVIDHTGKIVQRVAGNRSNLMPDSLFNKLRTSIATALANATTGIQCIRACYGKAGLSALRQSGAYHFSLDPARVQGPVSLRILDLQGRIIGSFSVTAPGGEAIWNGLDSKGNAVPSGTYFLRATGAGLFVSQPLSWTP